MSRYLSDNLFNVSQYPAHGLYSNRAEIRGNEIFRVGAARRSTLNFWTPATTGEAFIAVSCDRVRWADMMVIDRNSNLSGRRVLLEGDDNSGFTTPHVLVDEVLPTRVNYASRASETPGTFTEEGAYLRTFPGAAYRYWRLRVPDFGTRARVGGFYLGESYVPEGDPVLPWNPEDRELAFDSVVSPALWVGSNRKAQRRVSTHNLLFRSTNDYDRARLHLLDRYQRGRVMWTIHDENQAERSWLAFAQAGVQSAPRPPGHKYPTMALTLTEHQPVPR